MKNFVRPFVAFFATMLILAIPANVIAATNNNTTTKSSKAKKPAAKAPAKPTHEYVDLGLPSGTLWATTNVGASKPEESGWYFLWGETKKKADGDKSNLGELSLDEIYDLGIIDKDNILQANHDAATVNWGSEWRTPTAEEVDELLTLENRWTTQNGVEGRLFRGANNQNLFIPAAGCYALNGYRNIGKSGQILCSNAYKKSVAIRLLLIDQKSAMPEYGWKTDAHTVRPVKRKK